jgi:single-strand DNA-binding protein
MARLRSERESEIARETMTTVTGNLVEAPELRFLPDGTPVARFRVASTPRFLHRASGQWRDGETLFMTCEAWGALAEDVAESLDKGTRVIVYGRLGQRSWETKEGEKRTACLVTADDVAPSLRAATARVNKRPRAKQAAGA